MDASLLKRFGIGDAHCHPQEDRVDTVSKVRSLAAPVLAVMGTRLEDWGAVEALAREAPGKVIPCFGVHPWYAHRHALPPADPSDPAALLAPPSSGKDHPALHPALLAPPLPAAAEEWLPVLRALLLRHPGACVGECGLDRAAVVPGTKLQPSWPHQLALTEAHLRLAAELRRPASLHCVQGYGHLQEMLRRLGPELCPPKIMLHSFSGSVDMIAGLTKLPGGVGKRIYFGFSVAINGGAARKLAERLRAAPLDRILLESDQTRADGEAVDGGLLTALAALAEAREMTLEAAAEAAGDNFAEFYGESLAAARRAAARREPAAAAPTPAGVGAVGSYEPEAEARGPKAVGTGGGREAGAGAGARNLHTHVSW